MLAFRPATPIAWRHCKPAGMAGEGVDGPVAIAENNVGISARAEVRGIAQKTAPQTAPNATGLMANLMRMTQGCRYKNYHFFNVNLLFPQQILPCCNAK
jgi:hypothetical protein